MALSKRKHSGENTLLTRPISPAVKESFRDLKTKLSLCLTGEGARTLAITSTSKQDGQSFVAINLARTFAADEARVALVNADFSSDALTSVFETESAQSTKLSLARKDGNKQYIVSVIKNLECGIDFIPLNRADQDGEPMDDNAITSLIQSLKESYDFIIINAPLALSVAGMNTLASVCDGFALVCKKYLSRIPNLQTAIHILRIVNANVLGVIVNDNK